MNYVLALEEQNEEMRIKLAALELRCEELQTKYFNKLHFEYSIEICSLIGIETFHLSRDGASCICYSASDYTDLAYTTLKEKFKALEDGVKSLIETFNIKISMSTKDIRRINLCVTAYKKKKPINEIKFLLYMH